ncbi:MAG: hypothetical protein FJ146_19275 [Deltaproteobacteria bacterium]|nr:hypothetical protein [Deltaproteobacteria bacterium]
MNFKNLLVTITLLAPQLAHANTIGSLSYKAGQMTESNQSNGKSGPAWGVSFLVQTPDQTKEGKRFGMDMEFEVARGSQFSAAPQTAPFSSGDKVGVLGVGYNVGLAYIPVSNENLSVRLVPYLGLSSETLSTAANNFGFTGTSLGVRLGIVPKALSERFGFIAEYRAIMGDAEFANQKTSYLSRYVLGGVQIFFQ